MVVAVGDVRLLLGASALQVGVVDARLLLKTPALQVEGVVWWVPDSVGEGAPLYSSKEVEAA